MFDGNDSVWITGSSSSKALKQKMEDLIYSEVFLLKCHTKGRKSPVKLFIKDLQLYFSRFALQNVPASLPMYTIFLTDAKKLYY